jgi:hypothetical protein
VKKYLILFLAVVSLLLAMQAFADDAVPQNSDSVIKQVETLASNAGINLGKGVKLDAYLSGGKLWDMQTTNTPEAFSVTFTTPKAQWYVEGEVGTTIPLATTIGLRPFIRYQTLTNVFEEKTGGIDLLYNTGTAGAVGLRTAYVTHRNSGMPTDHLIYTGITYQIR